MKHVPSLALTVLAAPFASVPAHGSKRGLDSNGPRDFGDLYKL